jgi:hypothetical protein
MPIACTQIVRPYREAATGRIGFAAWIPGCDGAEGCWLRFGKYREAATGRIGLRSIGQLPNRCDGVLIARQYREAATGRVGWRVGVLECLLVSSPAPIELGENCTAICVNSTTPKYMTVPISGVQSCEQDMFPLPPVPVLSEAQLAVINSTWTLEQNAVDYCRWDGLKANPNPPPDAISCTLLLNSVANELRITCGFGHAAGLNAFYGFEGISPPLVCTELSGTVSNDFEVGDCGLCVGYDGQASYSAGR